MPTCTPLCRRGVTARSFPWERAKIHLASQLDKFVLYVARDSFRANTVYNRLKDFYGDRVGFLPANEELLLHRKTYHKSILAQRINALYDLSQGKLDCLVVSPQTLTQFLPRKESVADCVINIAKNQTLDMYGLIDRLGEMGYSREDAVEEKNTFSVAGDIISVFPSQLDLPIRISFFDDTVESIKQFSPRYFDDGKGVGLRADYARQRFAVAFQTHRRGIGEGKTRN